MKKRLKQAKVLCKIIFLNILKKMKCTNIKHTTLKFPKQKWYNRGLPIDVMNQVKINNQTIEFKMPKDIEKEITIASDEQKNFNNFYKLLEKICNKIK